MLNEPKKITNLADVYQRLGIIKSANDKNLRSRKVDYHLTYDVYSGNQHYKKSTPGIPICRLFVLNSKKDVYLDFSKLQRLQQDFKEVPIVVAFVSESCITYIQPGAVSVQNLT